MKDLTEEKGVLVWFAKNHVASNILMLLILAGGVISLLTTTIEIFPETSVDIITVTVILKIMQALESAFRNEGFDVEVTF